MTRKQPSEEEQRAGQALLDSLRSAGHDVASLSHDDRPDLRLIMDGTTVGVECTQIPPNRLFRLIHSRFKQVSAKPRGAAAVQVVWPMEAHVWAADAIREKNLKIDEYKRRAGTGTIDLLLHAPVPPSSDSVRASNPAVMNQIRWAAAQARDRFRTIYFWNGKDQIERIRPAEAMISQPVFDFSNGYPTDGFVLGRAPVVTTGEDDPPVEYDFGVVDPEVIVVPPLSQEFRKYQAHYRRKRYHIKVIAHGKRIGLKMKEIQ